jgi:hypothetical protein
MFAPPPTVATAEMSDSAMLLRCNASSTVSRKPLSGSAMSCSNSVRVTRISDEKPGNTAWTAAAVSADNCSLASLQSLRNRASEPTAAVLAGSESLASAMPATTWLSSA